MNLKLNLKLSENTKKFLKDAGIRAVRTMAQTALAGMSVGATVSEVRWIEIGSMALVSGIYSILMSLNNLSSGTNNPVLSSANIPVLPAEGGGRNDGI